MCHEASHDKLKTARGPVYITDGKQMNSFKGIDGKSSQLTLQNEIVNILHNYAVTRDRADLHNYFTSGCANECGCKTLNNGE